MKENKIILSPFAKAITSLKKALNQPRNEYTRDATIQRFEYTYELSWKLLKRVLSEEYGVKESLIKNIYREAGRKELIDDVKKWFSFHTARNLTSHTYNEQTAEETYAVAKLFIIEAENLLNKLVSLLNYQLPLSEKTDLS